MLLAIDVGNTDTVVGLFADDPAAPVDESVPRDGTEPAGLAHHWRLSTVDVRTADEHALLLTQLLDLNGLDIDDAVTGIAVTSSVPLVTARVIGTLAAAADGMVTFPAYTRLAAATVPPGTFSVVPGRTLTGSVISLAAIRSGIEMR